MTRSLAVVMLVLAGCGVQDATFDDGTGDAEVAASALASDTADRACGVVLRTVTHDGTACTTAGVCWWVFTGVIDVADAKVAAGFKPAVLVKNGGVTGWTKVTATRSTDAAPKGFTRFTFRATKNTVRDGLTATGLGASSVAFSPYMSATNTGRVFDHNRLPGALDAFTVSQATGWAVAPAPQVCPGTPDVTPTLDFQGSWQTEQHGALVAGGKATITYALSRLETCRGTHDGFPAWDVQAFVRFSPSGTTISQSVRGFDAPGGVPTNSNPTSLPFTFQVPAGSTSAAIWFSNFTGAGSSCEAWDSNQSANYVFPVFSSLPAVGWVGNAGSSFSRDCTRRAGVPDPVTVDSYLQQRACAFVTADVYAGGLTDAAEQHPEALYAQAQLTLDDVAWKTTWLTADGRDGNNDRFRFTVPMSDLYDAAKWRTLKYTLRFSTDGATWTSDVTRTLGRDPSFCNPAWGDCAL